MYALGKPIDTAAWQLGERGLLRGPCIGREFNRRIKLAFHEGVDIPFPHPKAVLPDRQLQVMVGVSRGGAH